MGEGKYVKRRAITLMTVKEKGWQIRLKKGHMILVEVSILIMTSYTPKL